MSADADDTVVVGAVRASLHDGVVYPHAEGCGRDDVVEVSYNSAAVAVADSADTAVGFAVTKPAAESK
jgi:hypothetical protein